jgi:hypothetical protein
MTSSSVGVEGVDSAAAKPARPQTPYQVLRMLPRDATPAQQDSAIQAWFQPKEIHYSGRPDTLHLPGHDIGRSLRDVNLPQYYRESFFSKDSLFHPELNGGRYGVAGDPIPYTVRSDNFFTSLLLGCFILLLLAYAYTRRFIARQLHDFFYAHHSEGATSFSETASELRFQFVLVLLTCLQLAIIYYFYINTYVTQTFVLESDYQFIGIAFGVCLASLLIRVLAYTAVNCVFFDGKKNGQWMRSLFFLTALEGVALYPVVLLQVYFDLSVRNVVYYFVFVVVLAKILTFYKCFVIFFRQNGFYLQIILYFCALEIIPFLALWGTLGLIVEELKINF